MDLQYRESLCICSARRLNAVDRRPVRNPVLRITFSESDGRSLTHAAP